MKIVLVFVCLFTFVSCGKENPELIVINTFKEIKQEIHEKAKTDNEKILKIFLNLIDKSSIIIDSVEKKEEITVVNTKIKSVDIGNYLGEMFTRIFSLALIKNEKEIQDEMVKFFEELNERKDLKYIENDLIIELKKS